MKPVSVSTLSLLFFFSKYHSALTEIGLKRGMAYSRTRAGKLQINLENVDVLKKKSCSKNDREILKLTLKPA